MVQGFGFCSSRQRLQSFEFFASHSFHFVTGSKNLVVLAPSAKAAEPLQPNLSWGIWTLQITVYLVILFAFFVH